MNLRVKLQYLFSKTNKQPKPWTLHSILTTDHLLYLFLVLSFIQCHTLQSMNICLCISMLCCSLSVQGDGAIQWDHMKSDHFLCHSVSQDVAYKCLGSNLVVILYLQNYCSGCSWNSSGPQFKALLWRHLPRAVIKESLVLALVATKEPRCLHRWCQAAEVAYKYWFGIQGGYILAGCLNYFEANSISQEWKAVLGPAGRRTVAPNWVSSCSLRVSWTE